MYKIINVNKKLFEEIETLINSINRINRELFNHGIFYDYKNNCNLLKGINKIMQLINDNKYYYSIKNQNEYYDTSYQIIGILKFTEILNNKKLIRVI
jgi:hypothetical protein